MAKSLISTHLRGLAFGDRPSPRRCVSPFCIWFIFFFFFLIQTNRQLKTNFELFEQIGSQSFGSFPGLLLLPLFDLAEVTREQHIGHAPAAELRRAGIYGRS